jgi:Caspase domain
MKRTLLALACAISLSQFSYAAKTRTGFVDSVDGKNVALLVGVTYGLPGIDLDIKNVREIAAHPSYRFDTHELWEEQGVVENVAQNLTDLSSSVTSGGTLFFYFSGHGSKQGILMNDRLMKIEEIRAAIEKGREGKAPLDRLVLMFDSCYSGALVGSTRVNRSPEEDKLDNEAFTQALVNELQTNQRGNPYWKKLFVFASSRDNETSAATQQGSAFTVNLRKAFDESVTNKSTVGEFVQKTQDYTSSYHHPVARLVPATLKNELLVP